MKMLDIEEMKAMIGTEFKYVFTDRDEIWAVIAAFDPEVGFTCLATETISMKGSDISGDADENGNICLVGDSPSRNPTFLRDTSFDMRTIRATGFLMVGNDQGFGKDKSGGIAACSFN